MFLVSDARRAGATDLERYFTQRALGAAVAAGALAIAGLVVLRADARFVYDGLTSAGLPLVFVSLACGVAVLVLLRRGARRGARPLAVGAVAAVSAGWGVAQYPYLLPQTLTIDDGAANERHPDERADRLRHRRGAGDPVARAALHARAARHGHRGRRRAAEP